MKEIQDPLYGYISVSDDEVPILDSQPVQRLRRIRQLGLTPLSYPGATHTRFEHSLGVMHLAGQFCDSLNLPSEVRKANRIAGLLHDVGHAPYSHATEPIMKEHLGISHEERSCKIVREISDTLPVPAHRITEIISGESDYGIVAGDVDADRMDYLQRDAEETGAAYGQIESETIIHLAQVSDGEIVFDDSAIGALENFFHSRRQMSKSVYSHHTSRIAERMLERAVRDLIDQGKATPEGIVSVPEYELDSRLRRADGVAGEFFERITNRNLFKRALYLSGLNYHKEGLREIAGVDTEEVEREIAEKAGIPRKHVIVDPPDIPSDSPVNVSINLEGEIVGLTEVASLPTDSVKWRNTAFGVYTPPEHREKVQSAAMSLLGLDVGNAVIPVQSD